jgi:hypothetical protein
VNNQQRDIDLMVPVLLDDRKEIFHLWDFCQETANWAQEQKERVWNNFQPFSSRFEIIE